MDKRKRSIIIAASAFVMVVLIMCLAAAVMMKHNSGEDGTEAYQQALEELAGKPVTDTPAATGEPDVVKEPETTPAEQTQDNNQEVTGEPTDTPAAEPTNTPAPEKKHIIAIDAGHQEKANTEKEPVGPDAEDKKIKVSWGATGVSSNVPEYKLTLAVALLLKEELVNRGYEVYMIRETHDVDISDSERAVLSNQNAEIAVHIHANADDREKISGIMAFCPSETNKYAGRNSAACKQLSENLLTGLKDATEAKSWGVIALDNLSELNWSTIPASHIEIGYMSNAEEDKKLQTEEYQKLIADGLADGIDLYFGE